MRDLARKATLILPALVLAWGLAAEEDTADTDSPILEGEGITFTATVESTQQMHRIERDEIERLQAPDAAALLEKAFHVGITRYGAHGSLSGVSLRGYGSGRVAILVDGVPVNSLQTGTVDLSSLSISDVEAVEVIYGGSDTKFSVSGAQGGVVNFITRRRKGEGSRLEATLLNEFPFPEPYVTNTGDRVWPTGKDFLDTQKARVAYESNTASGSFKTGLEGSWASNRFLFQDPNYKIRKREGSEVKDLGGNLSYLWNPSATDEELLVSGRFYWGEKQVPGPLYSTNAGLQEDLFGKATLHFSRKGIGAGGWSGERGVNLEGILDYGYEQTDYSDSYGDTVQKLHTVRGIKSWSIPNDGVTFKQAVDGTFAYLNSSNIGDKYYYLMNVSMGVEYYPSLGFGVFPYIKLVIKENTLIPVPKLGFLWGISEEVTLKNNWYRTFRLPALNDLYWPEDAFAKGNPDLKPEDGVGGDFIFEWKKPGSYHLEASLYGTYQKDAIVWQSTDVDEDEGKLSPINIATALYFGLGIQVVSDIHSQVKFSASYDWLLTYILTRDLTIADDKRMPYQPMHRFGAGVEILWSTGSLVITQKYESERYATIVNAAPLAPYFTLDISLNQKLGREWTLLVSGRNLLGANYQLLKNYPLPRAILSIGLRYGREWTRREGANAPKSWNS